MPLAVGEIRRYRLRHETVAIRPQAVGAADPVVPVGDLATRRHEPPPVLIITTYRGLPNGRPSQDLCVPWALFVLPHSERRSGAQANRLIVPTTSSRP